MNWSIPAKTFLVGEYAALAGGPAIILTTTPCFQTSLIATETLDGIHPESPAGQWWSTHHVSSQGLRWYDPYQGLGGLGGSSAQFIGAYLASCHLLHVKASRQVLLDAYYQSCWRGDGLRPSGYDVLAQTQHRCVYINRHNDMIETYDWPFKDLSFLLLHSGQKLATHYHLQRVSLPSATAQLSEIVEQAKSAFEQADSALLIKAVNDYQQQLADLGLVARHSLNYLDRLKSKYHISAAKGCGAMGADVLLLILPNDTLDFQKQNLEEEGWTVLASSRDLYTGKTLLKNNPPKTLEILP
ncbi:hypothetical protein [Legionella spiritensis]|uniref:Mevalonate kinase n=1 Tax=Legionella spiritensis TaxID=452 RepID=A0A0W0Z5M1_LEGSP|nr:hypothetical protein [Legionella spiritensis]KTD64421.1 hypothetical protein Lspi_1228 [Legionella spiritensis]SNV45966.1 mevalonate kinase [Legionella spiritensis]VEG91014.1 mevalonate kinase [Legionella spiritensis]